jgi:Glycosyltransferase family 92
MFPRAAAANTSGATVDRLAVCVKPLHFHYNRALWLVEFIELYKLLGTHIMKQS